jgi:hypothetical protein
MNEFGLFAHGEAFDADAYLAETKLRIDYVWRRGDQRRYSCVEIALGDGRAVPYFEQGEIAIDYLKSHRDELRALAKFPGVETFILGLQYHVQIGESTIGFSIGPSPLLMWHALDIGVRPTYYVSLDRRPEWECEVT